MSEKKRNILIIGLIVIVTIAIVVYFLTRKEESTVVTPMPSGPAAGEILGEEESKVCIQVITKARNPATGEIREFATPCDVPENWVFISK